MAIQNGNSGPVDLCDVCMAPARHVLCLLCGNPYFPVSQEQEVSHSKKLSAICLSKLKKSMDKKRAFIQTKHFCYTTQDYGKNLGDSLQSIAQRHNIPIEDLLASNPDLENKNLDQVFPSGTDVCVPVLAKAFLSSHPPRYYLVQVGDSLSSIARKLDIRLPELVTWNPQIVHGFVLPGERVFLEQVKN